MLADHYYLSFYNNLKTLVTVTLREMYEEHHKMEKKIRLFLCGWKHPRDLMETDTKSVRGHLIYPEAYTKLNSKVTR